MRLFTGIAVPEASTSELKRLLAPLQALADLRWSPPEKLHITTAFIGDWPEERLEEMQARLKQVEAAGSIDVLLGRLGWLPNPRFPRALYTGAGPYEPLHDLHKATAHVLRELGVELEDRIYRPHVTLARRRGRTDVAKFDAKAQAMETSRLTGFRASSFHLYLSAEGKYTKLEEYPL